MNSTQTRTRTDFRVSDLTVKLSKRDISVVGPLSFVVPRGTILGLVGESGSGKTTAGLALLGYAKRGLTITAGEIDCNGESVLAASPAQLQSIRGRKISYVPQDPSTALNPSSRIRDLLSEMITQHGVAHGADQVRALAKESLRSVGLPHDDEFMGRWPHELSGGQQQRVAIAMAFVCRPELVVLDEPTTGLDVSSQQVILDVVRSLTQSNKTSCFYISHDLSVVASIADRIAVMYSGAIVEEGLVNCIFNRPKHPYTARLIASVPDVDRRTAADGIPGSAPSPMHRPTGCSFAPRCLKRTDECESQLPDLRPNSADHQWRCIHENVDSELAVISELPDFLPVVVSDEPVLSVRNAEASYGSNQVLKGVDLDFYRGRCLALIGESGSGKTTFGRALCGLHTQVQGDFTFRGKTLPIDVGKRSRQDLKDIAYVFQNPYSSLNPRHTIRQNILRPLRVIEGRSARNVSVEDMLERVALRPSLADRYPDQLSGGERQRVAIARALITHPKFLICDEVSSALDVSVQASIVNLLMSLQAEMNLTILFITHDLALVRQVAQDVAVLKDGEIVDQGSTFEIFTNPRADYTKELLELTPHLKSKNCSDEDRIPVGADAEPQGSTG